MKKFSIICVYNKKNILNEYLLKGLSNQSLDYELILIDNQKNKFSSAANALNYGSKQAHGEYLIFSHQDILLTDPNWLLNTYNEIKLLDNPGIIGVAGKTNDSRILSNIKHGIKPRDVTPYKIQKPIKATTVDECIFIIPKKVFNKTQFDEINCPNWHLYATDYTITMNMKGYNSYIIPTSLIHRSAGAMDENYYNTLKLLQKKYYNNKIIRNCMADWYTFIPLNIQRKYKRLYKKYELNRIKPFNINYKKKLSSFKHILLSNTHNPNTYLLFKSKFRPAIFKDYKNQYNLIKNSGIFDSEYYRSNYMNNINFNNDAIIHYMFLGYFKAFEPNNYFNSQYYLDTYGNNKNPIINFLENESEEDLKVRACKKTDYDYIKESNLFDYDYYSNNYPETKEYENDLILHYLRIGCKHGYNPNINFDTKWYLKAYPKVKKANMNPLVHYIKYGQYEKRITKEITEEEANNTIQSINNKAQNYSLHKFDENAPLVSIIILNRNGLKYLENLFKNFSNNTCYPNYEIIIIDNNSSDDSVSFLEKLSKDLPIKIIKNTRNESFSKANNDAVKTAKGEYVLLLNNDIKPIYGWLNHMMTSYLNNENIGIVGSKLIYPYIKGKPTSLRTQNEGIKFTEMNGFLIHNDGFIVPYNIKENNIFKKTEEENTKTQEIAAVLGACLLIKKDLYLEVGGLDEEFIYNYEDIDLCFKVIQKGYKIIYSPKSMLYHYYEATRKNSFDLSYKDIKNRTYFYYKWNKWLCQELFIDKLNNNKIFSENTLSISLIDDEINIDELINKKIIYLTDNKTKEENQYIINNLDWNISFQKNQSLIQLRDNTDILIITNPELDPSSIQKHNKHLIKICYIKTDLEKYNYLSKYDLIILKSKEKYNRLDSEIKEKIILCKNNNTFEIIKEYLLNLYQTNNKLFNKIISNYEFEQIYPQASDYISILNSKFFDEKYYIKNYSQDIHNTDAIGHYLKIGGFKGYNPGPNFNSENYYLCNLDVKQANINPLVHYEKYGKYENRQINASEDEKKSFKKFLFLTNNKIFFLTKRLIRTNNNQIFFYSPWSDKKNDDLNDNCKYIYNNLSKKYNVVKYTRKRIHIGDYLDLLYNILSSKIIIIDNGFSLLSNITLKDEQYLINIWHACGAFKKIGYDTMLYSNSQLARFNKEFSQYDNFIVSSDSIRNIYANAHNMDINKVLSLGVSRTDIFFDEIYKNEKIKNFYSRNPSLINKEIILYAPTFRDNYEFVSNINWKKLSSKLNKNEIFVIKRHARMTENLLDDEYDNIIYLDDEDISSLMLASKLMITDYSSVIFEYSLLNKPIIHYCPDLDKYSSIRDFYLDFKLDLYGEIIEDPEVLIEKISNQKYTLNLLKLNNFKNKFMNKCDGKSTNRIVKLIEEYMKQ